MELENPKLLDLPSLLRVREPLRRNSGVLVLTNGCFDLLHTGHLFFLQRARQLGDRLVVALNADVSVKRLKGPRRPVQGEQERAFALGALSCVDYVLLFRTPDLAREIAALRPEIYTKAGDYSLERLHPGERAALQAAGARIEFLPYLKDFSTSALAARIAQAGGME